MSFDIYQNNFLCFFDFVSNQIWFKKMFSFKENIKIIFCRLHNDKHRRQIKYFELREFGILYIYYYQEVQYTQLGDVAQRLTFCQWILHWFSSVERWIYVYLLIRNFVGRYVASVPTKFSRIYRKIRWKICWIPFYYLLYIIFTRFLLVYLGDSTTFMSSGFVEIQWTSLKDLLT